MDKIGEKCRIAIANVLTTVNDSPKKKAIYTEAFGYLLEAIDSFEEKADMVEKSEFEDMRDLAINLTHENDRIAAENIELKKALEELKKSDEIAIEDIPEEEIDKMIEEVEKPVKKSKTKKG